MTKTITILLLILSTTASAVSDSTKHFEASFEELKTMIEGSVEPDFEKAVYLSEAPYWGNSYSYENFQRLIDLQIDNLNLLINANDQSKNIDFSVKVRSNGRFHMDDLLYTEDEKKTLYEDVLRNWAIFKFITDTTAFYSYMHYPFPYSTHDPFGLKNWRTSQVINLIGSKERSGNCYALTALYKILSDRLNTKATICTAPQHIYIQHRDHKGNLYNVELATAGHPSDGQLQTLTHTPSEGIRSGIALRSYNERQAIGLLLVNLAKSYERTFSTKSDDFLLKCAELVLKYDDKNLNALLLKQQVLDMKVFDYITFESINNLDLVRDNSTFIQLEENTKLLYNLGFRPMPVDMQKAIMDGFSDSKEAKLFYLEDKNPKPFTTITPLKKEDEEYVTLSGGLFKEIWTQEETEIFGHFVYETASQTIKEIEPTNYQKQIIDPVAFAYNFGARIYDSRLGRFLSTDPLEHKYSSWSPYVGLADNPIIYKDPDGRENVIYLTDLNLTKPGLSLSDKIEILGRLQAIAEAANKGYKDKGLTPRVIVIDNIPSADELDKSDVFATVGTKKQLEDFDKNNANHAGSKKAGDFDIVGVQRMGPEESTSMGGYGGDAGDRIALDIDQINAGFKGQNFESPVEYAAWLIQHGSGHNAAIAHSDGTNTSANQQQSGEGPDLMTSGGKAQFLPKKGRGTRNNVGPKLRSLFTRKKFTKNRAKSNMK